MNQKLAALIAATILAGMLHTRAAAQEIKGKKAKEKVIAGMRDLLQRSTLPGVGRIACTFHSEPLKAFYDSVWRASPDSIPIEMPAFEAPSLDFGMDGIPWVGPYSLPLPDYMEGAEALKERVAAYNPYLSTIFGFWLHFNDLMDGGSEKIYHVWRDGGGYKLDMKTPAQTLRARLGPDYSVRAISVTTSGDAKVDAEPAFTRIVDRVRLDSIRLHIRSEAGNGSMAIRYGYTEIDGRLLVTSAAIRAEGIIPIMKGDDDVPIDETITFANYELEPERPRSPELPAPASPPSGTRR